MAKKLQTIYEYFSDYSVQEIDDMIHNLPLDDKLIIKARYGTDLHNPQKSEIWGEEYRKKYYGILVPKMRRLLAKKVVLQKQDSKERIIVKTKNIDVVDCTSMLIQMLKDKKNNKEICENLNITSQQLYEELLKLRNKGISYSKDYYSDGTIKYGSISTISRLKKLQDMKQNRTIITDVNENSIKLLIISDLHYGNVLERQDLIDRAYNYCKKNGINIILCGGDLIDGTYTHGEQKISDVYKQIEYFIKNYPCDPSILTFSVAGNHDMDALNKSLIDIIEMCNNYRHDIVIGGYNNMFVNFKNDVVQLFHHVNGGKLIWCNAPITLHGHCHKYYIEMRNNNLAIILPTLSEIKQAMPSALELDLYFNKGYIANSVIKHLYFGPQDIVLSEAKFDLLKGRTLNYEDIKNEEVFKQDLSQKSDNSKVLKKSN